MNDAFNLLAARSVTTRRHCLPWMYVTAAPMASFVSVFVILGIFNGTIVQAAVGAQVFIVVSMLVWSALTHVGILTRYDTVVTGLPDEAARYERERYNSDDVKITLFVPDGRTYLMFTGRRQSYSDEGIIEDVERVDTVQKPHRTHKEPAEDIEYIAPSRQPSEDMKNRAK